MKYTLSLSVTTLALALISSEPAHARPMSPKDLVTLKRLASPAASPDGMLAAYQLSETDLAANKRRSDLYLVHPNDKNKAPEKFASKAEFSEHSPAFAAGGTAIYYISNESGSDQIWRYDLKNKSIRQISKFKNDVAGFKIAPDGKKIAIWGDVADDCFGLDCDHSGDKSKKGPGSGREYDALFVRHWDHWETPGNHSRIFTYGLEADGNLYGSGHPLDRATDNSQSVGDAPSKPSGGGEEVAWGADSELVYFAQRKADAQEALSTNLDIMVSHQNYDALNNLTPDNKATDTLPAPSPDGKWLAWAAMARPGYESDRQVLMLKNLKSGKVQALTQNWDRSVSSIAWAPDAKSLYVTAQDVLDHPVFQVDLKGKVTRLTQEGNANDVIPLNNGAILFTMNTVMKPNDLFMRNKAGVITALTDVNAAAEAEIDDVTVQRFSFQGANGDQVWGQITKPAGASGKLPVAFLVHGGPQGSFGNSWSYRWNPRIFASQGYAAVTIDFHGSTGYGQAFTDAINKDWGGKPLTDLKMGLAAAGKIDPQIDTGNACALGASYGGYMMNWIAGQWNDGFKCLVNHAGIFDLRAMAFETEELWFDEWDHGGPWWQRPDAEKWNPVNHVTKWKTPTLVTHGEKDFRIAYSQSLAAFTALQRQGIESKLLIFPDENHWISKPNNSLQWHDSVFAWLEKHLKKTKP